MERRKASAGAFLRRAMEDGCAGRRSIPLASYGAGPIDRTRARNAPRKRRRLPATPNRKDFPLDQTNLLPRVHLAVERLLDSIEARAYSLDEFEAAKARALRSARTGIEGAPASGRSPDRTWLRAAARLGQKLGACGRKENALQFAADFLRMPRFCARTACRKTQSCRGDARACLKFSAPRLPEAVRAAIAALSTRVERGDSLELAVALLPFECKAALWAWERAAGGSREDIGSHARRRAGHPRLSKKPAPLRRGWPGQARP
jgi:hypothetical protein